MKNIAVINAIELRPHALRPLVGGRHGARSGRRFWPRPAGSADEVAPAASRLLPGSGGPGAGVKTVLRDDLVGRRSAGCPFGARRGAGRRRFTSSAIARFSIRVSPPGCTRTTAATSPIIPLRTGFPYGLSAEILRGETAPACAPLRATGRTRARRPTARRSSRSSSKDINSFDIETELSPVDLRMLRASLALTPSGTSCCSRASCERGGRDADTTCRVLQEAPEILRTLPGLLPDPDRRALPPGLLVLPLSRFRRGPRDAWRADAGGNLRRARWTRSRVRRRCGRRASRCGASPRCIPTAAGLVAAALAHPGIELVIETSGVGWKPGVFAGRFARPRGAADLDRFPGRRLPRRPTRSLRGEGFAEALRGR